MSPIVLLHKRVFTAIQMSKTTRDRSLLFVAATILLMLLSSAAFLGKTASRQFNEQYQERLRSGLTTYGVILNFTQERFDKAMQAESRDARFLTLVEDSEILQLRRWLATSAGRLGVDALYLVGPDGFSLSSSVRGPEAPDVSQCFNAGNAVLAVDGRLYLTRALPLSRGGDILGYVCGALGITPASESMALGKLLRGEPFLEYRGKYYFLDAGLAGLKAPSSPRGEMVKWQGNDRHYFGMTGSLAMGADDIGIGLLVSDGAYLHNMYWAIAAILFSLLAMLLIGAYALRTRFLQRRTQGVLDDERHQALVTLASIGDTVLTTDHNGIITYINAAGEKLFGQRRKHLVGQHWETCLILQDEETGHHCSVFEIAQASETPVNSDRSIELVIGERRIPVGFTAAKMSSSSSRSAVVIILHDVSREREYQRELAWRANHDELTQLPNRRCFNQRLTMTLKQLKQQRGAGALLFLDLDKFKAVNDTAGHEAGDQLLQQVCKRFQQRLRPGQILARLGGDEFAILMAEADAEAATRLADNLIVSLKAFEFDWRGDRFQVGVSIGITLLSRFSRDTPSVMREADGACYAAKEAGRNCWRRHGVQTRNPSHGKHAVRSLNRFPVTLGEG